MLNLYTKFEPNRTIQDGVIGDLARCRRSILRGTTGAISSGLVVRGPNCRPAKFNGDIGLSETLNKFVLCFRYETENLSKPDPL